MQRWRAAWGVSNKRVRLGLFLIPILAISLGLAWRGRTRVLEAPGGVVIIGAGPAGLATAMALPQALIIEATGQVGGRAAMSGGSLFFVDTAEQRAQGVTDSVAQAAADWPAVTGSAPTAETLEFLQASAGVRDRLAGLGLTFRLAPLDPVSCKRRTHDVEGGGQALVQALRRAMPPGVKLALKSRVSDLILEDGVVRGVVVGKTRVLARRVVIATGGFAGREDLMKAASPFPAGSWGVAMDPWDSGQALDWAGRHGLLTRALSSTAWFSLGLAAPGHGQTPMPLRHHHDVPWIWVDASGRRFVDETRTTSAALAAIADRRPNVWALSTWPLLEAAVAKEDLPLLKQARAADTLLRCAPDWATLANRIGVDGTGLAETLRGLGQGTVQSDFCPARPPGSLPRLEAGEPCAFRSGRVASKSFGGLAVSPGGQVLSQAGKPIEGLYAVGEAAGMAMPGLGGRWGFDGSLSAVIWSGWRVGEAIAQGR